MMTPIQQPRVKFAVVGCGHIGSRHLELISANPQAEIVAICDSDTEVRKHYSSLYNVAPFTDFGDMLRSSPAEVVSICTPHALHASMAIDTINAGKHALVEKPMALTVHDTLRMRDAAASKGVHLMLVWQNRYNIPIQLTQKALHEARLGRIFMVQCSVFWNRPQSYYDTSPWRGRKRLEGGPLFTQCSHFLDLLIYLFGDIDRVNSIADTKNHNIETEDCGTAILHFESGLLGTLAYTTCVYNKNYEGSITIIAERGTIKIGGQYLNKLDFWDVQSYPLAPDIQFTDTPNQYSFYSGSSSNHDMVIQDVITTVTDGISRTPDWDDGHRVIRVIQMLYQSQEKDGATVTGQSVELDNSSLLLAAIE